MHKLPLALSVALNKGMIELKVRIVKMSVLSNTGGGGLKSCSSYCLDLGKSRPQL